MGPFAGVRVVELGGIGPGPFGAMVLADMGAEVVRVDRPGGQAEIPEDHARDLLLRSRRSLALDLKSPAGIAALQRMVEGADVLIDPFRPGVAERLGVGPEECLAANPRLIFARATGWGQEGPLARVAGHDINYVSLTGPLAALGRRDAPPAPALNLVGDFGGGGMLVAFGVAAALYERERSGRGQVIDAAMVDGSALLFASILGFMQMGLWNEERERNLLDGGAHFYDTYETADGGLVSIGALEPKFYAELLDRLGLDPADWPQYEEARWPELSRRLTELFRTRTRSEWVELLEGTDVCFAPVLTPQEAAGHPQIRARGTYVESFDLLQPAPAPRFSRTPGEIAAPPCVPGAHSEEVLADWGFDPEEVSRLVAERVVAGADRG